MLPLCKTKLQGTKASTSTVYGALIIHCSSGVGELEPASIGLAPSGTATLVDARLGLHAL
jgi:hypothetical protein